jgi:plasmid stabilization system protein ParE
VRKVFFSKTAADKLDELLTFLEIEWSAKVKQNFISKLDNAVNQIKKYPLCAEKSDLQSGLHRLVITKQTTIYYTHNENRIFIVAIFDTRQNPKKLKLK